MKTNLKFQNETAQIIRNVKSIGLWSHSCEPFIRNRIIIKTQNLSSTAQHRVLGISTVLSHTPSIIQSASYFAKQLTVAALQLPACHY